MKTSLFIGERDPLDYSGPILGGRTGERLSGLLGWTLEQFLAWTVRLNLLEPQQGWNAQRARQRWELFKDCALGRGGIRRVVLLGRRVMLAAGLRGPFLSEHSIDGLRILTFPHPSARSCWRKEAAELLRAFLR